MAKTTIKKTIKKDKKKPGRKTIFTAETIKRLEEAFAQGCTDREACIFAEVSERAFYEYTKKNLAFVQKKNTLREMPTLTARLLVNKALNRGDEDIAKWYLERKRKDEFSTRAEMTGADGEGLKVVVEKPKDAKGVEDV